CRLIDADAAARQQAAEQFGDLQLLGDAKGDPVLTRAPDPAPAAQAAFDAQDPPRGREVRNREVQAPILRAPPTRFSARSYDARRYSARCRNGCASPRNS